MSTEQVRVGEVMSTPLETISSAAAVRDAAKRMRDQDINSLFVPGAEAGIVTQTDVVAVVANEDDPDAVTVADVMTAPVERVTTDIGLGEAAAMMNNFGIKHLPVIDEHGEYVGMVSSTDMAAELA